MLRFERRRHFFQGGREAIGCCDSGSIFKPSRQLEPGADFLTSGFATKLRPGAEFTGADIQVATAMFAAPDRWHQRAVASRAANFFVVDAMNC